MPDHYGLCDICKNERTQLSVILTTGVVIYMCSECEEKAEDDFIWLCLCCGKSYNNPKWKVILRTKNLQLKKDYMLCEDSPIIHGIDSCMACNPWLIIDYIEIDSQIPEC